MFSKFFSLFIALSVLTAPAALAQSADLQVELSGPDMVKLQDTVRVVLEVTDTDGKALSGLEPEITFDPGEAVSNEWLYDCEDPEFYDYCKANHRGVAGIFEIQFVMEQTPVLVEVNVNGVLKGLRLNADTEELFVQDSTSSSETIASSSSQGILPEQVQAGPSLPFWSLALPFMMLMSVVSFFVFSTTP